MNVCSTDTPRVMFWNTSGMTFVKRGNYIPEVQTSLNLSFDLELSSGKTMMNSAFKMRDCVSKNEELCISNDECFR